jgi:hypothetical protein
MPRKIIQIALSVTTTTCQGDYGPDTAHEETMYALTDDGLVFYSLGNSPTVFRGWRPLVAIPQGDIETPLPWDERKAQMVTSGEDE